jgi:hypothetical protein
LAPSLISRRNTSVVASNPLASGEPEMPRAFAAHRSRPRTRYWPNHRRGHPVSTHERHRQRCDRVPRHGGDLRQRRNDRQPGPNRHVAPSAALTIEHRDNEGDSDVLTGSRPISLMWRRVSPKVRSRRFVCRQRFQCSAGKRRWTVRLSKSATKTTADGYVCSHCARIPDGERGRVLERTPPLSVAQLVTSGT